MTEERRRKVMDRAWQIQAEAEKAADVARTDAAMRVAAAEVGLDPEHIRAAEVALEEEAQAEEVARVAAEDAARVAAEARRVASGKRWAAVRALAPRAALGVTVVAVAAVSVLALRSAFAPPEPFVEDFTGGAQRWAVDASAGTDATVTWASELGRGEVAVVTVDAVAVRGDGTWVVNLDSVGARDLSRHETISFDARGEGLTTVRLYLEHGDERWRSPPISLASAWATHSLPISAFERQVRTTGWKVTGSADPGEVDTISFKLGQFMNSPEATGSAAFDNLRVE